ncbi:MAG: hypothetical protein QOJ99_1227 [Bryobacterales bacterium]|nr:hypothetical protein [Bryobacterales bacterium]
MSVSVRAAVEPLNTALGHSTTIFIPGSFTGLPLINQALAGEHPLGNGGFFVTVRSLIKVLGAIPVNAVVRAVAVANAPPSHSPSNPPPTPPSKPPSSPSGPSQPAAATCGVGIDPDQPGFGGIAGMRIFGSGFLPSETIDILEGGQEVATTQADSLGFFKVHVSFVTALLPIHHTVHAHGRSSGRTSNDAGFTV